MDIIELVNNGCCQVNLQVKDKKELLQQLAGIFSEKFSLISADTIYRALLEREELGTSGFGGGLALPHARMKELEDFAICIVTLKRPIKFDSVDKKRVGIVIAILGPDNRQEEYLRLLANISKNIRSKDVVSELKSARSEEALREIFAKYTISLEEERSKLKDKLLIINLKDLKYFDVICHHFLERGVTNALVLESSALENYLMDSPLFSGFLNFLTDRSGGCKTIMAVVNEKDVIAISEDIERIMGNLDTHTGAQIIAFDLTPFHS